MEFRIASPSRAQSVARAAAVLALLLALLAVVALASTQEGPRVGSETDVDRLTELRDIALTVGATLYVIALAATVWILSGLRATRRATGPTVTLVGYLALLLVAAGFYWVFTHLPEGHQPAPDELTFGPRNPQLAQPPLEQPPEGKALPSVEFRWELAGALLLGTVVAVVVGVLPRRRAGEEVELDPLGRRRRVAAELATIVERTLDDLRREADPRRAVIAAYAQMEAVLAQNGLPRDRAEAPFEYLARVLRELRVREAAAVALTELFEQARFSDHAIDADMKREAIDELIALRDSLRPGDVRAGISSP